MKNELNQLENDIITNTKNHNLNIAKFKEDNQREIDCTVHKLDFNYKNLLDTFETMQNKYADLQVETKRLEMDKINLINSKEDEQTAIRHQSEQINMDILQSKGSLQFAKKEQDNLISEIKTDTHNNEDYINTLINSSNREKEDIMQKIKEQKQSNYETLDNINNTKINLGNELYRVDDLVKGQTIHLDTIKRDGDL